MVYIRLIVVVIGQFSHDVQAVETQVSELELVFLFQLIRQQCQLRY